MPRYIADSYLYRAVGADIDGACGRCIQSHSDCMCHSLSRMDICGIIEDAPTVDAMEVVRCKDCKWYDITHPYGTVIPDAYHCKINDRFYGETHFCAYGERKNDEERA